MFAGKKSLIMPFAVFAVAMLLFKAADVGDHMGCWAGIILKNRFYGQHDSAAM
jgi:hypothetical protein